MTSRWVNVSECPLQPFLQKCSLLLSEGKAMEKRDCAWDFVKGIRKPPEILKLNVNTHTLKGRIWLQLIKEVVPKCGLYILRSLFIY
jgi:hypothetical protein